MVYLGGFDTHSNQAGAHTNLLRTLSDASEQFILDLQNQGLSANVVGMTMSEFGRRNRENGSLGTDHGTASSQFLFGEPVNSGVLGADPDFDLTDSSGDFIYNFDYRQIYSEILEHWFNVPKDDVTQLLGGRFIPLPILRSSVNVDVPTRPSEFELLQNYPNPFSTLSGTTIPFSLAAASAVELVLIGMDGRTITTLAKGVFSEGKHLIPFTEDRIPAGRYFYQLRVGEQRVTRTMMVLR